MSGEELRAALERETERMGIALSEVFVMNHIDQSRVISWDALAAAVIRAFIRPADPRVPALAAPSTPEPSGEYDSVAWHHREQAHYLAVSEPRTEAGRALLAGLRAYSMPFAGELVPVDLQAAASLIADIEAEVRAAPSTEPALYAREVIEAASRAVRHRGNKSMRVAYDTAMRDLDRALRRLAAQSTPEPSGLPVPPVPSVTELREWLGLAGAEATDETATRLQRRLRARLVARHSPHDQDGEPNEGFPVCSRCGAIQTGAAPSTEPALDAITVNGHLYVHVAACPCPAMQAEVARLAESQPAPDTCGVLARCGRPKGHRGHHGGWRT